MIKKISLTRIKMICLVVFFYPLLVRSIYVDTRFMVKYNFQRGYGSFQVLVHDALIYFVMLLLFYISFMKNVPKLLSILLRIGSIGVFIIYVMDIIVFKIFCTRLTFIDCIKYISETPSFIQLVYGNAVLYFIIILLTAFVGLIIFFLFQTHTLTRRTHGIFLLTLTFLGVLFCFSDDKGYAFSWIYKNIAEYNSIMMSQNSSYSEKFITNVLAGTPQKESAVCVKHTPQRKNIIILMVESFSLYQSKFFSGINDWTPNIDAIAEKNVSFTNFYANGFITEDGELAILTGRFPLYGPYRYKKNRGSNYFQGYYGLPDTLPRVAGKKGYVTEFITSADLDFSDTGNWAKSIGFDYTEGQEHPYYNDFKRYHFKAAPDAALYDRVFDRIFHNQSRKSYLMFIKTVSTHHPYINPENENYSESEAFRYADRQVGLFYRKLLKSGFFKDGILVIVGDHHAMVPLKQEEIEQFGAARAAARIPLVICYGDKGGLKDERAFQQVDLCNSLKNLISDTQCTSDWTGDLLNTAHSPARYIIFRRGDRRDIINIFYEDRDLRIQLDGDKTRMINSGDLDRSFVALFVNKINRERIVNLQQSAKK